MIRGMRITSRLLCACLLTVFCRAIPATTQSSDADVDRVLDQLSSDDFATRKKAQDALVQFGEPALTRLHSAVQSTNDPEARSRIKTAIQIIERKSPNVPTRISLHLHNASPKDALAAIEAQSGVKLRQWPENIWQYGPIKTVTLNMSDGTYWTAMRGLCDQAELTLQMFGYNQPLQIQRGNSTWSRALSVQDGPYLVVAESISKGQSISLDKPNEVQRSGSVNLSLWPEPKVPVLKYASEPTVYSMVDETGTSVLPKGWQSRPNFFPGQQTYPYRYNIPMETSRKVGSRIRLLKGAIQLRVLTKRGRIIFDDPVNTPKNTAKTLGGKRIVLNSCHQNPDKSYSAEATIYREGFNESEWQEVLQNYDQFRLVDARGVYRTNGTSSGADDKQLHTTVSMYFDQSLTSDIKGDDKPRLIWNFSLETKEVMVPFEFRDLPLPEEYPPSNRPEARTSPPNVPATTSPAPR